MSHSVSPLGSLSSPSPSPSPPPNPLDESELSELTDDDHDTKIVNDPDRDIGDDVQSPPRTRKPPSTVSAPQRQRQRQRKHPPVTYASRTPSAPSSSKRKKRGGLVPAPMWGWAYKGEATDSPTCTSTPAQRPSPATHSAPLPGPSRPPDPHSDPTPPPSKAKSLSTTPDVEEEEEEEEDLPAPPRAMEEEEGEDADPRKDRPPVRRRPSDRRGKYANRPPRRKNIVVPMPFDHTKIPRSKHGIRPHAGKNSYHHEQMLKSLWQDGYRIYDSEAPTNTSSEGGDDDTSAPDLDDGEDEDEDEDEMDVDNDAEKQYATPPRQSPTRPPFTTTLKPTSPPSTSIMDPTANNPSVPPSVRASVDPTVSLLDEDLQPGEDADQEHDPDVVDEDDRHPAPDGDMEVDGDDDDEAQLEEPSQPPSPTPLPEPEPEPEDEDLDLQPAHRAEALDVLATIELKFALLRERVYVEKMDDLAWEESLVCDGTHPELHYLQEELTKRRDKRLLLASRKRTYEIEAIARKRREEETWCWDGWDVARTELQTEMIAETNRKRRRLERERRSMERPLPARRVPSAILNPPPAPTLRQIANTFPLPFHLSHLAANKKLSYARGLGLYPGLDGLRGATAYPDLPTLVAHEIAGDLEYLFQQRRMGYGFSMGFPPIGVSMGVDVGYNSSTPGFGPTAMNFAGPTPTAGFGVNALGIGGPAETYPLNPGPSIIPGNNSQIGAPPLAMNGSGTGMPPLAAPTSATVPSQNAPNAIPPGPGITNPDGPPFSQPAMGVFQAPPSSGAGPTGYPLGPGVSGTSIVIGPGGTTSTPIMGPGGARSQRPAFVEREREPQRERDRELATQRERELREREREFGPNGGAGYLAWGSKPPGSADWGGRREEKDRIDRNERERERDRSQVQPIVPTPTHRHVHPHSHSHPHTNSLQHHVQPHTVHANQSHSHPHSQHPPHHHSHTPHQHATSHALPHHHVGQHHHHRHHHHVVHRHHPAASSEGPSSHPSNAGPTPGVQTMEIIDLSANPSSKTYWKRDEAKLGGSSMPGSRPSSTHPPLPHNYDDRDRDRERERDRERDRPIATSFVLGPSHHLTSSPRRGWTPGPGEPGPGNANVSSGPFPPPPERFHTPIPHRYPNPAANGNGISSQLPRPLTTSPPRAPPAPVSTSPSMSAMNIPPSSTGPFPLPRKPSPALPKLGMPPLGYSPRLAGPGVVPPTGPGVPGVLSTASGGPGVTASGILTSGPGVPPGPGVAPAPAPMETNGSMFPSGRTTSPLIPYNAGPPVVGVQRVGVDGL